MSRFAIAYVVNSLWQLPLLFLAAEMIVRLLGRARGRVLCFVWGAAVVLSLFVPALSTIKLSLDAAAVVSPADRAVHNPQAATASRSHAAAVSQSNSIHFPFSNSLVRSSDRPSRAFSKVPRAVLTCILYLYLGSIVVALVRLGRGLWQTHTLIRSAGLAELDKRLQTDWEVCMASMGVGDVKILSTSMLSSPATLHWPKPILLLPSSLENVDSAEMSVVFCHELAHVARKDFVWNIAIDVLGVLLFYHPAFHWMRRRIQETRELACDDMAAEAMCGRRDYARNLLSLTQKMLSAAVAPQPGCALGIFEGEVLEKRIMNLLEKRSQFSVLRLATSAVLGTCLALIAVVISANFGVRLANAQSAAQDSHVPSGWYLAGSKPANYSTGTDRAAMNHGQPSAFLRSTVSEAKEFGTLMQSINATEYAGKRVRLRVRVRSQDVADWAGIWMRVDKEKTTVAFDNMQSRAIKGTQSWTMHDVVLDVPQNSTRISYGILLAGAGEVWMNDVMFETVGEEVPVTAQAPRLPNHPTNLNFTE